MRDDTSYIQQLAPNTWKYLLEHQLFFQERKSSIYRGASAFFMFGVGNYSYEEYKVGMSGFYKTPLFSLIYSTDGKPVMVDDTCYFICFPTYELSYIVMLILNTKQVQTFLKSIVFLDAKRPYTKRFLARIDFSKIIRELTLDELKETERIFNLAPIINSEMYEDFQQLVTNRSQLKFEF